MYDAIWLASQELEDRDGRKVMVIVTDGGDTYSIKKFDDALQRACTAPTPSSTRLWSCRSPTTRAATSAARTPCRPCRPIPAAASSTRASERPWTRPSTTSFTICALSICSATIRTLRRPSDRFHRVQVKVTNPGLRVLTRNGYYGEFAQPEAAGRNRKAGAADHPVMAKSKTRAPEQTLEEVKYLKRLIDQRTQVRIKLTNDEEVRGHHRVLRRWLPAHHPRRCTQSVSFTSTTSSTCSRWAEAGPARLPSIDTMASFLDTAQEIAREAGALLMSHYGKIGFELKGDFDLVTAADRASEHLIIDRLRSHYPSHAILGEEHGVQEGRSEYQWYVDPLDGTTNFAHSYPVFNVSMGLGKGRRIDRRRGVRSDTPGDVCGGERRRAPISTTAGFACRRRDARRRALLDRLSQPQAPSEHQHSLLPSAGDDHARRAPRRRGGDRPRVRGQSDGSTRSGNSVSIRGTWRPAC